MKQKNYIFSILVLSTVHTTSFSMNPDWCTQATDNINQLQQKVIGLEQFNNQQVAVLLIMHNELIASRSFMNTQLERGNDWVNEFKKDIHDNQSELQTIKLFYELLVAEVNNLKKELHAIKSMKVVSNNNSQYKYSWDSLSTDIKTVRREIDDLQEEWITIKAQVILLEQKKDTTSENLIAFRENINTFQKSLNTLYAQQEKLKTAHKDAMLCNDSTQNFLRNLVAFNMTLTFLLIIGIVYNNL